MHATDTKAGSLPPVLLFQWIVIRATRWGVNAGALIGIFLVGFSWPAFLALALGVLFGLLSVTLAYHRYFAHRSFKTSRRYPVSARHGFYWREIDITYYVIKLLEALHLVHDVKTPPSAVLAEGRNGKVRA